MSVRATGLPPGVETGIVQCDDYNDTDDDLNCLPTKTVTSASNGSVTTTVVLTDPASKVPPFGDDLPVYCRADICRIFVVWQDGAGDIHSAGSGTLQFTGSPATIQATPNTDLVKTQQVHVSGTAHGAEGQHVQISEEQCGHVHGDHFCQPSVQVGTAVVASNGTWAATVTVRRVISDASQSLDCADSENIGTCQLTAHVLKASGEVDRSFGDPLFGHPGAQLGFRQNIATLKEYTVPTPNSAPTAPTLGYGGFLYFGERLGDALGKLAPGRGTITEIPLPTANADPVWVITGFAQNIWFTERSGNKIGRLTTKGRLTEFTVPTPNALPSRIAKGPNNLAFFFTESGGNKIGKINTAGQIVEFPVPTANSNPLGLTAAADGNVWFVERDANRIGRVTVKGKFTEWPIPTAGSLPNGIVAWGDDVWFAEEGADQIGRINVFNPGDGIREYRLPNSGSGPRSLTQLTGSGCLWFNEFSGNRIGGINEDGFIHEFTLPTANSGPTGLTSDSSGNLWFGEQTTNRIGRLKPDVATFGCSPLPGN